MIGRKHTRWSTASLFYCLPQKKSFGILKWLITQKTFQQNITTKMNFKSSWRKGKGKFKCSNSIEGLNNGVNTRLSHVYIDANIRGFSIDDKAKWRIELSFKVMNDLPIYPFVVWWGQYSYKRTRYSNIFVTYTYCKLNNVSKII